MKNLDPLKVMLGGAGVSKFHLINAYFYRYLTKLVLEVIGVAPIPTFIIDAIAVCTQISYEKFGHPQGLKQ